MSKKIIKLILPFLLILFLIPYNEMTIRTNSLVNNNGLPTFQADPIIIIDDDTDFGPSGYNFPGSGSAIDPYIIEGFEIEAQTVDDIGILVTGTTM
ncbi:MAG: hypothetical protein H7641_13675, partial [Candidatus Heimdallarchaeota archaeon]|nr:hypothetical protein [Candidatus Heimdallarchaeota archaeon]MCK4878611.1 hypothetical protein [Candidatus Heimdallarchaeota archaeon]